MLRILRWGLYPGLSRRVQFNHKDPYEMGVLGVKVRERKYKKQRSERRKDAALQALAMRKSPERNADGI